MDHNINNRTNRRSVHYSRLDFRSIDFSDRILFFTDGELEAQWLVAAGFSQLTKAFQEVNRIH